MTERLVFDSTTPEGSTYRGPAEVATAPFRGPPEQIAPARLTGQAAATLADRLRSTGRPLLRMRAWADTSPTFWTSYRIELVVAAPSSEQRQGYALQASPFPFLIVGAVLLALGLVALAAWQISNIEWGPLGFGGGLLAIAAILALVLLSKGRTA